MHGQEWKVANKMTPLFPSFQSETMWFIHLKLVVHVCCLTLKSCKLIYTLWPEVCGHSNITLMWLLNFSFKNTGHQFAVPPLLWERKGKDFGNLAAWICSHSTTRVVVRWCTDVVWKGLGHNSLTIHPRGGGYGVGLPSTPNWRKHFIMLILFAGAFWLLESPTYKMTQATLKWI